MGVKKSSYTHVQCTCTVCSSHSLYPFFLSLPLSLSPILSPLSLPPLHTHTPLLIRPSRKSLTPPRLDINTLDFSNREHVAILEEMGIVLSSLPGGKVQISHLMQKAKTPEDAEEGWHLMQDIMRLMNQQQNPGRVG